jgi:hypothetical protein
MPALNPLFRRLYYALLVLVLSYCASAQTDINTSFSDRMNYVFQRLEKNRVPNGLLLDYALEFTNLSNFNGTLLTDSNKVMSAEFGEIYNTLYLSRIHSNGFTLQNPSLLDSLWFSQRAYGKIVLSGLFYNYSRFRDDAAQNNLIAIQNDQVVDRYVKGVWQDPYQSERVFAVAPSIEFYEGKNLQVILPVNLWQTNAAGEVSGLSIDLGDGQGYRAITVGQPITVNYADTGTKEWIYRLQLTSGQYLYSHSQVRIQKAIVEEGCANCRFGATNPDTIPFTANEPFQGLAGTGFITIRYRDADRGLRRPLIVVEGFDPGHITSPELRFGTSTIDNFYQNVSVLTSGSTALENIITNFPEYDIIYVDWDNGTDWLQRNGRLLETIINWVNANKEPLPGGGVADNVILGQSMGGVIARWALRDMETRLGQQHHTRLFISMDAPQQGANVPVAYQHLARHLRNLYLRTNVWGAVEAFQWIMRGPSLLRMVSLADRSAARQMLINWVDDAGNIDNTWHDQWQAELRALDYPQQNNIRNIAISNGTECGTTQPFAPGAELLNLNGKANTRFLGDLVGRIALPLAGSILGWNAFYLGVLPGRNDINYEFIANAQPPQGQTQRIYRGTISYTKKVLWVVPVNVTITDRNNNSNPALLPYDYYPGGQIDIGVDLNDKNFQDALVKFTLNFRPIPTFSFIPTPSALDIGHNNVALDNSDYLARYIGGAPPTGAKSPSFVNFVTAFNDQRSNEQHIGFFRRNGDWTAEELRRSSPADPMPQTNCSAFCGVSITGPDTVCDDAVFGVPAIAGATYTWTVSGSPFINAVANNNTIAITRRRPGSARITLTVQISSVPCGTTTVSRTFQYGAPPATILGPYDPNQNTVMGVAYTNKTYYFLASETSPYFPAQSYTWTLFPPAGNPTLYGGSKPYITFSETGYHTLQVSKMTECGAVVSSLFLNVQEDVSGFSVMTAPNPVTSDVLSVTIESESAQVQQLPQEDAMTVELYDFNSAVKRKQWTLKNYQKQFQLNLTGVPKGLYVLRITKGNYQQSKQIIKE